MFGIPFPEIPDLEENGIYAEVQMEKPEWKAFVKETVKSILKYKPEAVYVGDHLFEGLSSGASAGATSHSSVGFVRKEWGKTGCENPVRFLRKNWTISRITLIITDTKRLWALLFQLSRSIRGCVDLSELLLGLNRQLRK